MRSKMEVLCVYLVGQKRNVTKTFLFLHTDCWLHNLNEISWNFTLQFYAVVTGQSSRSPVDFPFWRVLCVITITLRYHLQWQTFNINEWFNHCHYYVAARGKPVMLVTFTFLSSHLERWKLHHSYFMKHLYRTLHWGIK